jgi:hypothetical protein
LLPEQPCQFALERVADHVAVTGSESIQHELVNVQFD